MRYNEKSGSIMNFGRNEYEYQCSGECYCSDNTNRRIVGSAASTASKGMKVFLTAISATVAFKIAKTTFQHDCENRFSESSIPCTHIHSEIKDCQKANVPPLEIDEDEELEVDLSLESDDIQGLEGGNKYQCRGHCVNLVVKDDEEYKKSEICESFKFDQKVRLIFNSEIDKPDSYVEKAKYKFALGPLNSFCMGKSISNIPKNSPEGIEIMKKIKEGKMGMESMRKDAPFCSGVIVGRDKKGVMGIGSFDNVECEEIPNTPYVPKPYPHDT